MNRSLIALLLLLPIATLAPPQNEISRSPIRRTISNSSETARETAGAEILDTMTGDSSGTVSADRMIANLLPLPTSVARSRKGTSAPLVIAGIESSEVSRPVKGDGSLSGRSASISASDFSGVTFDAKVNACLAAAIKRGTSVCDARGLTGRQTIATTITVGDGTHPVTLLLPAATIIRRAGAQILYNSNATIIGMGRGRTLVIGDDAVSGIAPAQNANGIYDAHLAHLSTQNGYGESKAVAGSVGLQVGGATGASTRTDVLTSVFADIDAYGADEGISVPGKKWGCTCYNHFYDIYARGTNIGTEVGKCGSAPCGVNSNIFEGGTSWGAIGLYAGGNLNVYIKPDMENCKKHAIELAGSRSDIIAPYEEASGQDLIDPGAEWNLIDGGGAYIRDDSGNTTNMAFGPGVNTEFLNASGGLLLGGGSSLPAANLSNGANLNLLVAPGDGAYPLDWTYGGGAEFVYGRYGHSHLGLGHLNEFSGMTIQGAIESRALANPPAPAVSPKGTTGSTSYSYYVVCHQERGTQNDHTFYGGDYRTNVSPAGTTATGKAALSIINYNHICWKPVDGCASWDVLKGNTTTALYTAVNPCTPIASWQTCKVGLRGAGSRTRYGEVCVDDVGQATRSYAPPIRNATADARFAGRLTEGCAGIQKLRAGSATVMNSCISGSRPVICTDNSARRGTTVSCVPSEGTLRIYGTGKDRVAWAQL